LFYKMTIGLPAAVQLKVCRLLSRTVVGVSPGHGQARFPLPPVVGWARIAQSPWRLGYGLDERGLRIPFPARVGDFSLLHNVYTGCGAHPASYTMWAGDCSSSGKL
jgi:hypothetical protein